MRRWALLSGRADALWQSYPAPVLTAELAAFSICLLAHSIVTWAFVLLKGLLRSLGIRLRDQT